MRHSVFVSWLVIAIAFGVAAEVVSAQSAGGTFTAAQAESGRALYAQTCSGCHGADFEGSGDAPSLAGGTFLLKWRPKMVSELFGEILQNMPPAKPGSLSEVAALNAAAYILQRNGAPAGQQALTAGAASLISAVVSAQTPDPNARAQAGGGRAATAGMSVLGAGGAQRPRGDDSAPTHGVSVAGEVKNYVPVTPEMLKNPAPEDWLIDGRNYQRHSYSPLTQITRANVKSLQLKWTWSMNDSGANQTFPIVHNGIIYLASPSNIVQAIDGKTGDLIWETRAGPDQAPGYGGIRSIAIAEDKMLLATSDAHMVAINARNGQILWDTPASDTPHTSTSGVVVIGDKALMGLTGCGRFNGEGCYIGCAT